MPRRLVVCADGTWNTPDETDHGVATPTNVCKMRDALADRSPDGVVQLVHYHEGVGTGNWLDRIAGGALGEGIDRNIKELYQWLAATYQAGDETFLFGFSRGAYTVRSLAGFIRNCGLLRPDHLDKLDDAYAFYRDRTDLTAPASVASQAFRAQYAVEVNTTFIGVWDTVGALGIPVPALKWLDGNKYEFHDVKLSTTVRFAYQALAIDEERVPFQPCVWESQLAPGQQGQTLEQVWFAGVHSNVGGGYPMAGLSDLTFEWMRKRAAAAGLAFKTDVLGAAVHPDPTGKVYDSMSGMYKPLGRIIRPIRQRRVDAKGDAIPTNESLHRSALQRWETDRAYKAPNIRDYIMRFPTSGAGNVTDT
ncbi:MAG TPA: DUF2235 domain-containing protein [Gemmatimonadaceae bacterium]|nr:DUF2235 domain-containing protein [Gemmatimonadaceae bacterium]